MTRRVAVVDAAVDHRSPRGVVHALAPTSLSVESGSSLAIMGPSGCGKSTLLGLLAGLATPTTGTVTIGDEIVSSMNERQRLALRRRSIGMVYQADNLLPHLTVEENVGLQRAICGRSPAPKAVADVLERLEIGRYASRLPDQLSGGQRQRVAVARAVIHEPGIILADEPTGALDVESGRRVIELLTGLQRTLGATLIVVTHDPSIAEQLDHLVRLQTALAADLIGAS